MENNNNVLEIRGLNSYFFTEKGVAPAVDGLDLDIPKGKIIGLVGESGCGKSMTAKSIMGLLKYPGRVAGGSIRFEDQDLTRLSDKELRKICGNDISMIFQEPMTSLNPVLKVGRQVRETLLVHNPTMSKAEAKQRVVEMFQRVGIPEAEKRYDCYPHELSGGLRQRVMIAMAMVCKPKLLIADEPTTALDVTIQAKIIELIKELKEKTGSGVILITHDLGVVASACSRVYIMYGGKIVETGLADEIYYQPQHPYTSGLLACVNNPEEDTELRPIPGSPPDLIKPPAGCPFVDRCDKAMKICKMKMPPERKLSDTHAVCCWLTEKPASGKEGE